MLKRIKPKIILNEKDSEYINTLMDTIDEFEKKMNKRDIIKNLDSYDYLSYEIDINEKDLIEFIEKVFELKDVNKINIMKGDKEDER